MAAADNAPNYDLDAASTDVQDVHNVSENEAAKIDTSIHAVKCVRPCVAGDQWFNPEEPKYVVTFASGLRSAYPHG